MLDQRNDELDQFFSDRKKLGSFALDLSERYECLAPQEIIGDALSRREFSNCAAVSSFGAESAVLLHMLAQAHPKTPVILIDTLKLFGETSDYARRLQHSLGLEKLITVAPSRADLEKHDPLGTLSGNDPNACCEVRKTVVLQRALSNFSSWMNGRKRYQSTDRSIMAIVEMDGPRLKLNPLASWGQAEIKNYHIKHELPTHPLVDRGYQSIGCYSCTSKVKEGEDPRSGRWRGLDKTECGIHGG